MTKDNVYKRQPREQRRVVVTGVGTLNPCGVSASESWQNLISGRSGIGPITQFDASQYDVKIAGEIKGFNPDEFVPKKEQKKMDRFIQISLAATAHAMKDSGLVINEGNAQRTGVYIGVGMGGLPYIEAQHKLLMERGPSRITPFFIPAVISNLAAGHISMQYGAKGPNFCITSACASGAHSIGEAYRSIRGGYADVMIAGGTEATVSGMAIGGFAAMRALSTRNSAPELASRPWDRDRDGFVLSEATATLILEDYEHAVQRGARIYCEVLGYGASGDAHHMTSPAPGGEGAALAMHNALLDAEIRPDQVDYINAHGTSTPTGDELETMAIKKVFKDHAKKVWVSSTKSMTGHALGAAGAIESVFCVLTLAKNIVPPTINLENPSPDCDLDFVPMQAREKKLNYVLNNSFGFGGTNTSLVFARLS